jgi:nitroreductase
MKKQMILPVILGMLLGTGYLKGQGNGSCVTDLILSSYSNRQFTEDPVPDHHIDLILQCGIKAPSARNSQLWKFTVVKNSDLMNQIVRDITPGNILIVVSGQEGDQPGINVDFDCALATENMFVAAESMGLGAHIYGSPVANINDTMKGALGIPEDYRAVTVLRIGSIDTGVDAVSAASARKSLEDVVIYR